MEKTISLLWMLLMATTRCELDRDIERSIEDSMMLNRDYPKPGDIPILNRKVFQGQRVPIREHPYTVSIRRQVSHYLTATLLTRDLVISVAHPLDNVPIMELGVVVGENYSDRGNMLHTVCLVIIHEDFDPYTLKADIALIRIYEEVHYKGNAKSIGLISPTAKLNGLRAFVTGWGRCDNVGSELCLDRSSKYYPNEIMDPMLRTVTFTMNFPNNHCDGYKNHEVALYPGMLCTGAAREEDQVCPCLGVPGAALVAKAKLVGLLSWGFGCGYSYDLPLVYTSVQHFSSWIAYNIRTVHVIKQKNLTDIFEATKAAILSQWLIETRVITPKLDIRLGKSLEPLDIDYEITKLRGRVYDFRDYVSDGFFHAEKKAMYESIRNEYKKIQFPSTTRNTIPVIMVPFIGKNTLDEIGFNKNDIANITATSATGIDLNDDDDDD